jgi:hypothetical protein
MWRHGEGLSTETEYTSRDKKFRSILRTLIIVILRQKLLG